MRHYPIRIPGQLYRGRRSRAKPTILRRNSRRMGVRIVLSARARRFGEKMIGDFCAFRPANADIELIA